MFHSLIFAEENESAEDFPIHEQLPVCRALNT